MKRNAMIISFFDMDHTGVGFVMPRIQDSFRKIGESHFVVFRYGYFYVLVKNRCTGKIIKGLGSKKLICNRIMEECRRMGMNDPFIVRNCSQQDQLFSCLSKNIRGGNKCKGDDRVTHECRQCLRHSNVVWRTSATVQTGIVGLIKKLKGYFVGND